MLKPIRRNAFPNNSGGTGFQPAKRTVKTRLHNEGAVSVRETGRACRDSLVLAVRVLGGYDG